jgi:hypothetical protein
MPDYLRDNLVNSEKIIWSGRPAQGFVLTSRDALLIPFSLLWAGVTIFWEFSALNNPQAPISTKLFGVPFVLISVYFVIGRFFFDAWLRRGMQYAVTNKRVLIYRPSPFRKLTAMKLNNLPEADLSESTGGRGTIRFGPSAGLWGRNAGFTVMTPALDQVPQFIGIENARNVFQLIQHAVQSPN